MLVKEDLVLIHRALSELVIKGSESHAVSGLLDKVASIHAEMKSPIPKSNSSKSKKVD